MPATPMKDAAERYSPEIAEAFQPTETPRPATKKSEALLARPAAQNPMPTVTRTVRALKDTIQGSTAASIGKVMMKGWESEPGGYGARSDRVNRPSACRPPTGDPVASGCRLLAPGSTGFPGWESLSGTTMSRSLRVCPGDRWRQSIPIRIPPAIARFAEVTGITAVVLAAVLAGGIGCATSATPALLQGSDLAWQDLQGRRRAVVESAGERGLVMVYLSVDCPIANRCLPELEELAEKYRSGGLRFVRVYAQAQEGPDEILNHGREYRLKSEAFRDPDGSVAKVVGARCTPEAVVVTREGRLVYRGRINDQFEKLGVSRPQPTRHDLAEALEAYLAGEEPRGRSTPAVGCRFR